jgi:hypothetical protein
MPDFEQYSLKLVPQQGWPMPPQTCPLLEHDPVSVQVPAPPPHIVPPAMQTPSTLRHPVVQTLPVQAGWLAPPQGPQVPLPPPLQDMPAS